MNNNIISKERNPVKLETASALETFLKKNENNEKIKNIVKSTLKVSNPINIPEKKAPKTENYENYCCTKNVDKTTKPASELDKFLSQFKLIHKISKTDNDKLKLERNAFEQIQECYGYNENYICKLLEKALRN